MTTTPSWTASELPPRQAVLFFMIALVLNSFFAILGSLLWDTTPYWPAYMISVLVTAKLGWYGVLLAALSPLASTLLGISDSPFYLYISVNVVQMTLALLAFRYLQIAPSLGTSKDKTKYLLAAIVFPSVVGGLLAWYLRSLYPTTSDPRVAVYVGKWTTENVLPALFPGLWIHKVVGEFYRPFNWESGGRLKSWTRQSLEQALPWVVSMMTVGAMLILIVVRVVDQGKYTPGLEPPGFWQSVSTQVIERIPGFPLTILALSVSFLCSLGYSIRHAKQSWILAEAVRRYFPNQRVSQLLLSGIAAPTEESLVTVLVTDVESFEGVLANASPRDAVAWLNNYFTYVADACSTYGGAIDGMTGDHVIMVFGLTSAKADAREALACALEIFHGLAALNMRLASDHAPALRLRAAMHSGAAVAGVLGSPDRRQYSVLGDAVTKCLKLEQAVRDLPDSFAPLIISRECLRETGLLSLPNQDLFVELAVTLRREEAPEDVFCIAGDRLEACRRVVGSTLRVGASVA